MSIKCILKMVKMVHVLYILPQLKKKKEKGKIYWDENYEAGHKRGPIQDVMRLQKACLQGVASKLAQCG